MILRILGHSYHYEMENLCRVFFPNDKIELCYDESGDDTRTVETRISDGTMSVKCCIDGKTESCEQPLTSGDAECQMAQMIFDQLSAITGYRPAWGILTGVRPSKLMRKLAADMGEDGAVDYFRNAFFASEDKISLTRSVSESEKKIISLSVPESFSLYVSIPFCPTRCNYCSFVSHSISSPNARALVNPYIDKLCEEITSTAEIARSLGLRLESIYFGGGTPSVLEASQLDRLFIAIENNFDLSTLREYTVECGRPDTITAAKLRTLRVHNVGRISINPQTFSQKVLDEIGRKHTVEQSLEAYSLAKASGFDCINMDLIAGLTGDTVEDFCAGIDTAITLAPENITVHSLALKHSSNLAKEGFMVEDGRKATEMVSYANERLSSSGYNPYYMYRQSKCVGNLENVGWAFPGKDCLYNVFMMEECHTVLAVGAGAVTRLKAPNGDKIERIFNFKYPYEYISRFDELIERKELIESFYASNS